MNTILKKIALLSALPALAAGFTGCTDDDAQSVSSSQQHIILEQTKTHRLFEIRSNTAWSAACVALNEDGIAVAEPWFMLTPSEGLGTTQVNLDVMDSNLTDKTRKGRIVVTCDGGESYVIDVAQRGLTEIESYVTPQRFGLPAAASAANAFTVGVANREAKITAVLKTTDAVWLKNLRKAYDLSYGYSRKENWTFDLDANLMSDARTATIEVTVVFGYNTYKHLITVTQNGLGAPAVKTATTVYMNCAQTAHRQTIWTEGGNRSNVEYEVTWTSACPGVGNTAGWITGASVTGEELVITADPNTDEDSREGSVMIVAHRPGAADEGLYATLNVKVVQAGHKAAGIVVPVAEAVHPYPGAAYSQPIVLLNGSAVESVTTNDEAMFAQTPTVSGGMLAYTLNAYDGAQSDYREGIVTIVVANGHSNKAAGAITVRQYAPGMPQIGTMLSRLTLSYEAQSGVLPLNPETGTTVTVVGKPDWMTAPAVGVPVTELAYTVTECTSTVAREGVVTLKAANDHVNAVYYYLTVCQQAARIPTLNVPAYFGMGCEAVDGALIPLNLQGGTITVESSAAWLTAAPVADGITLAATANTAAAATNYKREALVTIRYTKNGLTSYYYINVCQYARDMAYLTPQAVSMTHRSTASVYGRYGSATVTIANIPGPAEVEVTNTGTTGNFYNLTRTLGITSRTHANTEPGLKFEISVNPNHTILVDHDAAMVSFNPNAAYGNSTYRETFNTDHLVNSATIQVKVNAYPYVQHLTLPCTCTCTEFYNTGL